MTGTNKQNHVQLHEEPISPLDDKEKNVDTLDMISLRDEFKAFITTLQKKEDPYLKLSAVYWEQYLSFFESCLAAQKTPNEIFALTPACQSRFENFNFKDFFLDDIAKLRNIIKKLHLSKNISVIKKNLSSALHDHENTEFYATYSLLFSNANNTAKHAEYQTLAPKEIENHLNKMLEPNFKFLELLYGKVYTDVIASAAQKNKKTVGADDIIPALTDQITLLLGESRIASIPENKINQLLEITEEHYKDDSYTCHKISSALWALESARSELQAKSTETKSNSEPSILAQHPVSGTQQTSEPPAIESVEAKPEIHSKKSTSLIQRIMQFFRAIATAIENFAWRVNKAAESFMPPPSQNMRDIEDKLKSSSKKAVFKIESAEGESLSTKKYPPNKNFISRFSSYFFSKKQNNYKKLEDENNPELQKDKHEVKSNKP